MNLLKKFFYKLKSVLFSNSKIDDDSFQGIVVAKVTKIDKHPNADRLRIVFLDIGDRSIGPVVCGANNFAVGDTVALALPGATIAQNIHSETHEPFILAKAVIRGVESQGMICAAFELGLGPLSEKPEIMLIDGKFSPGMTINKSMFR